MIEPNETITQFVDALQIESNDVVTQEGHLRWFFFTDPREARRYLEAHLDSPMRLLDLTKKFVVKADKPSPLYDRLKEQLRLLRFILDRGATIEAIRDAYVNFYGGMALDIPEWLAHLESQIQTSRAANDHDTQSVMALLWLEALTMAECEEVAVEIIAAIQVELSASIMTKFGSSEDTATAIRYLSQASQLYEQSRYPHQWASVVCEMSTLLLEFSQVDHAEIIEQAIIYYQDALVVIPDNEDNIADRAMIISNLGVAYVRRIRGSRSTNLEQAILNYQAALQLVPDATSTSWAMTQNNLGNAYRERIRGDHTDNLEQSIACYAHVLRVYTEDAFPVDWAMTQNNLGNAYRERIRGDHTDNLEQSIACYAHALRVYTEDAFPVDWAMTQNNLGNAYRERIRGDHTDNLEQSIACYAHALRVYTEDAFPLQWAITQNNLGVSYHNRIQGNKADNLEVAIACYTAALRVRAESSLPMDWAMTQNNLGTIYHDRIRGERAANMEEAIACYTAAMRVYTEDALPHDHRGTALNLAEMLAEIELWGEADAAYRSALRAEDALVALASDARGQDAILAEGRDGAARDAFALVRLGRLADAAAALEKGLARGLATARALAAADPQHISDPVRRANYVTKRAAWQEALALAQQTEERLPRLEEDPPEMRHALRRQREVQHSRQRVRAQHLAQARAAFDESVTAIRAAHDPANFLLDDVSAATLMQAARRGPTGHAIVALVATPRGGMALGTLTTNPRAGTPDRFAVLDLPAFTDDAIYGLISQTLDSDDGKILGGFSYAQEGSILGFLLRDWADRRRPAWDGTLPLREWEALDQPRREVVQADATFVAIAGWLHDTCQERAIDSNLDAACQDVLAETGLCISVTTPWRELKPEQFAQLSQAIGHAFLLRELERSLTTLSALVMRPLASWLRAEGVTSVTLIPCGYLTAFPLLACELGGGQTFADAFTASVAPSFRSVLLGDRTRRKRSGVATLGNPFPTHQPLKYGQAEALTLAHLGGDPARCRIQHAATREWLQECLRDALVVDASCHGFAKEDYLASSLILADHPFTLADALNHQMADTSGLRLLILSACQTAIPDLRGARNEAHSLAVGMLQAGVEAIIAALWSVDDRATYLLIVRFAQEWFPNMATEPPAAALARAQRWLRTVTCGELQSWEASSPLPSILTTMPDYHRPTDLTGSDTFDVVGDNPTGASSVQRYGMHEGQVNNRFNASRHAALDPNHCLYAHPFFWAAFQITGW